MKKRVERELRIVRKLIGYIEDDIKKDRSDIAKDLDKYLLRGYKYTEEILIRCLTGE